ncbi:MAG: AAA family ATPase, partial [Myxococcales bacterium]|nr:AAA family ATPase [Myxococcales bacterium]
GALVGTFGYMSPEAIEHRAWGPASDVFALGVMLYELVTGVQPFKAANAIATVMKICDGDHVPVEERVSDLPPGVGVAIEAALQRDPEARPASALELATLALGRPLTLPAWSELPTVDTSSRTSSSSLLASGDGSDGGAEHGQSRGADQGADATQLGDDPTVVVEDDDAQEEGGQGEQAGPSRAGPTLAPFVGRKLELETLGELLATAIAGEEVPVALILGEAGQGRTRFLQRFAELAAGDGGRPVTVLEGRFWRAGEQLAPALETFVRLLPEGTIDCAGSDPRAHFADLARALEERAGAQSRALLLLLDDIHHASARDLEFLTYLVRGDRRALPVLVVASARVEAARSDARTELSRWLLQLAGLRARTSLTLAPFDEEELRAWLDGSFGLLRIHPRDLRRLRRASGGNPYQLSEFVRHLVASGRIRREGASKKDGGWSCARLDRDLWPEGLSSALGDQLAALDPPLLQLLEVAAVIGEPLAFPLLERAMGPAARGGAVDELVDQAVARGLLLELGEQAGGDELG